MTEQHVPVDFAAEIDRLLAALQAAEGLLSFGRPYGFTVALSPALAAQIDMRHGEDAARVLSNTQRVDPRASFAKVAR
jgi:hypothetical protein